MTLLLRILRLIALATWVGSLIFFIAAVAPVAFRTMPDAHQAGLIVRGTLQALHRIGLGAGLFYLFVTLAMLALGRDTHPVRALELVAVVGMVLLTLYLQLSVLPRMEVDRLSLGGDVAIAPATTPARVHFDRLHALSVKLEGAVLIGGLGLLALAPLHGRDDEYRRSA